MQAYYGRNGECPMPIVSASTPSDCFSAVYEAVRISVQHMTPVMFLSDGYIANGAEPWKFPVAADLPEIKTQFASQNFADVMDKRWASGIRHCGHNMPALNHSVLFLLVNRLRGRHAEYL